jgi:hypothetical protein
MKKLLLLPLVAIGLALVPMKQADAQVSVGIGPVGIGFGYPAYRYSYYGYPGYYGYYPRSYYRYYGLSILPNVLQHWAAVLLQRPSILQASQASLLPLLKTRIDVRLIGWLGAIPSQLFFCYPESSRLLVAAFAKEFL